MPGTPEIAAHEDFSERVGTDDGPHSKKYRHGRRCTRIFANTVILGAELFHEALRAP